MHVHDKFIVVDFNGDNPTVFTGSSNLAEGGEKANGDSLIMVEDQVFASVYAIEALKMFDHYSFRDKMKAATAAQPLTLWYPGKPGAPQPWWTSSYDPKDIKFRDRCLFANIPLPATLQSHKDVDWSSIGMPAKLGSKQTKPTSGSGANKKGPAKAPPAPKPASKKAKPAAKKKQPQKGAVKKMAPAKKATAKSAGKKGAAKTTCGQEIGGKEGTCEKGQEGTCKVGARQVVACKNEPVPLA
jgi:hypothetical protein